MTYVLVLADDLTGALEAGAKFAAAGMRSLVSARAADLPECEVPVIDTETRHLSPEEAAGAISAVPLSARLIYKKTDSTLRGNIAAELGELARRMPDARIAYLPAYPAMGRTVRDGQLYVDGVPVHRTTFGCDEQNPVAGSSIAEMLGEGLHCAVYDGETDADLAAAVAAALADPDCRILAGPASVAGEIAKRLAAAGAAGRPPWPGVRRCLVVNGSRHEISGRQVEFAIARGAISDAADGAWRLLAVPACPEMHPLEIAAETGDLVAASVEAGSYDAVMTFGGDTAFGVLKALGFPLLEPIGEIVAGVPVARVEGRDLHLITKAGGFGGESLICRVKDLLYGQ
jgi:uncharacterized protein YgbK (DUF1537 family)